MEQDGCIPFYAPLLYSRLDTFEMNDQLTNVAAPQDASRATGNYALIQRLILRHDAICGKHFECTTATAFT